MIDKLQAKKIAEAHVGTWPLADGWTRQFVEVDRCSKELTDDKGSEFWIVRFRLRTPGGGMSLETTNIFVNMATGEIVSSRSIHVKR